MTTSPSDTVRPPRRRFRKRWLLGGIAIALVAVLAIRLFFMWSFDKPLPPNLAEIGQLQVTRSNGQVAQLRDLIRPGVPTVISLWASWCGPCFSEVPKIAELRRQFSPDELNMIYVNIRDPYASKETLDGYMARFAMPLDYVVMNDPMTVNRLTNDTENLVPRTFIFDADGRPIGTIVGYKPLALSRVSGLVSD